MVNPPLELKQVLNQIHNSIERVDGWLTNREVEFLALLAACPTADGEILELGSYCGKSTIALANAALLAGQTSMVTVDPNSDEVLTRNLKEAGVDHYVDFRKAYSSDVINNWQRPIRLLWHDGANTYDIVSEDIQGLIPFLQDSAIVAFHDVLNPSGDRIQVFIEQVLESESFSSVGICGTIGWGQFKKNPDGSKKNELNKLRLKKKLEPLVPYQSATQKAPQGFSKLLYKLLRARVPHGKVDPADWVKTVSSSAAA